MPVQQQDINIRDACRNTKASTLSFSVVLICEHARFDVAGASLLGNSFPLLPAAVSSHVAS